MSAGPDAASGSRRVVVLGGGFAGLWSAVGAARRLAELGHGPEEAQVTLVNRDAFHAIRVRNYEADPSVARLPLDLVLGPVGVARVEGEVVGLDAAGRLVEVSSTDGPRLLPYDRLVFALGSRLVRPDLPGLEAHAFDVDTYDGAARLDAHLRSLPGRTAAAGTFTVVVVGAGPTGIEVAAEMPARLRALTGAAGPGRSGRVVLLDHGPRIGADLGAGAQAVVEEALGALGVEVRTGVEVAAVGSDGATLRSGEILPAATVVWCAGMRASPATALLPVERDPLGRLPVDAFLRVEGVPGVFAAGDAAAAPVAGRHRSVPSCQHSRPMGRYAGHNVVCDLFGLPLLPLALAPYVTVVDLGAWGAVYTEGWDRRVAATGEAAKRTKETINRRRIYPPTTGDRDAILAAAAPVVQPPPETRR